MLQNSGGWNEKIVENVCRGNKVYYLLLYCGFQTRSLRLGLWESQSYSLVIGQLVVSAL